MQVFSTRTYERAIRKLLGEEARREMEDSVVAAPDAAPVIRGTGGIRKLRWAGSGRGKRGGIRTVYFYHAGPEAIYFLTAYAKANREDLTPADTKALSRLVAAIKKETSGR
ncbi:MAG: type II toxin-antitoxin system RelE/ParE family toxin [Defluviicoccus sp.]|nr:type II toxin-antitoxin system RelE/ParE family toxin [Defluviicoccus sp.]MDE0278525.1 type II toxin-antitoxin system RelE/ParE family toxin [Defluviicoccus sp.]